MPFKSPLESAYLKYKIIQGEEERSKEPEKQIGIQKTPNGIEYYSLNRNRENRNSPFQLNYQNIINNNFGSKNTSTSLIDKYPGPLRLNDIDRFDEPKKVISSQTPQGDNTRVSKRIYHPPGGVSSISFL